MSKNPKVKLTEDEAAVLAAYHSADILSYLKLMIAKHGMAKAEQAPSTPEQPRVDVSTLPAEKPAPLPPSYVAREASRARKIAPEIRAHAIGMLDEIRQVVEDKAYRVMADHPDYEKMGMLECDAIATALLHAVADFLVQRPDINQLSEYHSATFFDCEVESDGTVRAFDITDAPKHYKEVFVIEAGED